MGKHYGAEIISEVLRLKAAGETHRSIGEKYGLSKEQIHDLVKRYNRNKRKKAKGILPKMKGRPRTGYLSEKEKLAQEINQLQRENDLLRSFLQAVGRM